jgi:N-carbamoylputrescine amidase
MIPLHPGLRVALAQIPLEDGDLARNMHITEKAAWDASLHNPDFLCFPEAIDFGWLHQGARHDALPIPGKYTDFLATLAARHRTWVCAGCLEKDGESVYNSAVVLDRAGRIVHKHRKIRTLPDVTGHIYDASAPGGAMTFTTEFGRIGLTICADNFDIAIPQQAAQDGAWLLITPHGFVAPEHQMKKNARAFRQHICRIAAETGMWVVGTNVVLARVRGGAWKDQMHCGCSTVAKPDGSIAIVGKFSQPDLIVYDIPPAAMAQEKANRVRGDS